MALHALRPRPAARVGWWAVLFAGFAATVAIGLVRPASAPATSASAQMAVPPPLALGGSRVATAAALATMGPITFPADSAALDGASAATVQRLATILGSGSGSPVLLVGYVADTPGPADVAQRLSEQRAAVVADALVAAGVDRSRIAVAGHGATDPLISPAASRRVEVRLP